jgi:putative DNA primase/helicase
VSAFDSLADEPRWVAWRNERRGDKLTKVPYGRGGLAKANDPATWILRAEATLLASRIANGYGGGIGIELGDLGSDLYLAGVDLDSCIDDKGCLAPWAEWILVELPTYCEVSPSGTGIKAFFYVASDDVRRFLKLIGISDAAQWGTKRSVGHNGANHGPGVEIYFSHRFFAVTYGLWPGKAERISTLDWERLEHLAQLIPNFRAQQNAGLGTAGGRDTSRSAKAFREGARLRREGKTFEEMCEALRTHADPDTRDWAREKGGAAGQRELHRIWDKAAPADVIAFSEDDLALRFSAEHAAELRYLAISGKWYRWDGELWRIEETLQAFDLARTICRSAAADPRAIKLAREIVKAKTVVAVVNLARADRQHATAHNEWNANDWRFVTCRQ